MQKLVATSDFIYAGRHHKTGDVFEVEDAHVRLLTEGYHVKAKRYQTAAMTTETSEAIMPTPKRRGRPPKNSGFYNRADMRAEKGSS